MPDTFIYGKVRWFSNELGYGFIEHPEGDVMVHHSEIKGQDGYRRLRDEQPVSYQLHRSEKGLVARNVRRTPWPKTKG